MIENYLHVDCGGGCPFDLLDEIHMTADEQSSFQAANIHCCVRQLRKSIISVKLQHGLLLHSHRRHKISLGRKRSLTANKMSMKSLFWGSKLNLRQGSFDVLE